MLRLTMLSEQKTDIILATNMIQAIVPKQMSSMDFFFLTTYRKLLDSPKRTFGYFILMYRELNVVATTTEHKPIIIKTIMTPNEGN